MKMLYVPNWRVSEIIEVETLSKPDELGFVKCELHGLLGGHSLFPLEARNEILDILSKREAMKKEYDDSIGLVYKLNNAYHGKKGWDKP